MVLSIRVEVLVVGEAREWELVEYAQDSITAGNQKSLIILGHVVSEQGVMKYCTKWLKSFVTGVPVEFVPAKEPFWNRAILSKAERRFVDIDHHRNCMAHGWGRIGRIVLRSHQQSEALDLGNHLGSCRHLLLDLAAYLRQRHSAARYASVLQFA